MAVSFDATEDFADVVDGLEAVTVNRRGSSDDTSIGHALQRAINTHELGGQVERQFVNTGGKIMAGDVRWHLPIEECATAPRIGDVIVGANSDRWTVLAIHEETLSSRWKCICRNLRVAFGLDDTITIEEAVYEKGTAGAAEATWHTRKTGIAARVQPATATPITDHEARVTRQQYQIQIEHDVELKKHHRIRWVGGIGCDGSVKYRILNYTRSEDVGQLQTILAEAW